jgi:tetratricopeptide (TPR) repeat protein
LQIDGTAIRLAMRFGNWDEVRDRATEVAAPDEMATAWVRSYREMTAAYARGMKAVESGQLAEAEAQSNLVDALLWRLSKEDVGDKDKGIRNRMVDNLGTASLELRGQIAGAQGKPEEMRKFLESAVEKEKELGYAEPPLYSRPALESLGHAFIRTGKFSNARDAFQKELHERPRSGFALYGIALAWDKEGNREEGAKAYHAFMDAWAQADPDLPQIKAAQAYLAAGGR